MKRAILVSSGTLAGLVAVLTYSGGDTNPVVAAAGSGSGAGLGGPPPAESTDPSTAPPADGGTTGDAGATGATGADGAASPTPSTSSPAAAASPTAAAAKPTTAPTKAAAKPAPAATKAVPVPAPTKAAPKPTPTPKPTVAVAKDYVGSLQTHKYGKVQVGIRVKAGKIIAVWPVVYPNGDSQPYSDFSIPVFKSETLKAQGANIANVSGATLTWQSWKKSLQSAMAKAGI
jgi:uncharacterized protein with FMN-binding domain